MQNSFPGVEDAPLAVQQTFACAHCGARFTVPQGHSLRGDASCQCGAGHSWGEGVPPRFEAVAFDAAAPVAPMWAPE